MPDIVEDPYVGVETEEERQAVYRKLQTQYDRDLAEWEQKETERQRQIYDNGMRLWDTFHRTAAEMDARFDKTLFSIAAGSFGISFAFIDKIVPLAEASCPTVLVAAWACFSVCLVVTVLGHLISAETYRKQRDQIAINMGLQYEGKTVTDTVTKDMVSPCNYIALISYIGGIACLLSFVLLNL
jgi:hypothetical protein